MRAAAGKGRAVARRQQQPSAAEHACISRHARPCPKPGSGRRQNPAPCRALCCRRSSGFPPHLTRCCWTALIDTVTNYAQKTVNNMWLVFAHGAPRSTSEPVFKFWEHTECLAVSPVMLGCVLEIGTCPKSANFGPVKGLKKIKENKEIKISQKNPKR